MTSELDSLFDTLSLNAQGSERGGSSDSDSTGSLLSYSSGSDITHSFLTGGSGRGSPKLEVFQGLLLEFGICDTFDVPKSIGQCKKLLRASLHINIKQYLKCKKKNGSAIEVVKQYPSRKALSQALNGSNIVKLSTAKAELMNPLLVIVRGGY